jgi:hypothetical protein
MYILRVPLFNALNYFEVKNYLPQVSQSSTLKNTKENNEFNILMNRGG